MQKTRSLRRWSELLGEWGREYRPAKNRTPTFLISHLHEEASEVFKCFRKGQFDLFYENETKHGHLLSKPEGLPAELADVLALALILCDEFSVDPDEVLLIKYQYLQEKLTAKKNGKK